MLTWLYLQIFSIVLGLFLFAVDIYSIVLLLKKDMHVKYTVIHSKVLNLLYVILEYMYFPDIELQITACFQHTIVLP
jgi:hypothetical protein